jgi:hypothetical protein
MRRMKVDRCDLGQIAAKSLRNCHAEGLDSIMFDDTPEDRVRCFVAHESHNLYRNSAGNKLSVAFHSHHCDVKLVPIFGEVWNVSTIGANGGLVYQAYEYHSEITNGSGSFKRAHEDLDWRVRLVGHELTRPFQMAAKDVHTVFVPADKSAAWFVYEGAEDPDYNGLAWSNDDLGKFDFSPLYKPMSVEYLTALLGKIGAKIV